jgi:LuxR family transcriptional regulator, quorum-sensing system regulator LasR
MVKPDQLRRLAQSETPDAWSEVLYALARECGFDRVLFGMVASRHAKLENAFLRSNYPPEWRAGYDTARLAYDDPTVSHCLGSTMPIVWQPGMFCAPAEGELYEEAGGYGVRIGVTFPIHGPNGEFGIVSFASNSTPAAAASRALEHHLPDLALIRDYAFPSASSFLGSGAPAEIPPRLTRRELEVLSWAMAGKSSWEISKIICCSEATINFHMANVRQKFNVNTRQQAVVKAIALGLIIPEDHHR